MGEGGGGGAVLSFYTKTRSSVFADYFVSDKLTVSFRQNIFNQPVIQLIVTCSVDTRVTANSERCLSLTVTNGVVLKLKRCSLVSSYIL